MVQRCRVKFHCRGVLLIWKTVGQGPVVLAEGAGGGCLDIFLTSVFSFSVSLSEGWSGGAMVLGKLPVPRRPTVWISVGQWGGRVVRWCWANFQCRGVLQFGLQ